MPDRYPVGQYGASGNPERADHAPNTGTPCANNPNGVTSYGEETPRAATNTPETSRTAKHQ